MSNKIKNAFGTPTAIDINLTSLPNGGIRHGANINFNGAQKVNFSITIKLGSNPSAGIIPIYFIRKTGSVADDSVPATKGNYTPINPVVLEPLYTGDTPQTNDIIKKNVVVVTDSPEGTIAVGNETGVPFAADGNSVTWNEIDPEIQ